MKHVRRNARCVVRIQLDNNLREYVVQLSGLSLAARVAKYGEVNKGRGRELKADTHAVGTVQVAG